MQNKSNLSARFNIQKTNTNIEHKPLRFSENITKIAEIKEKEKEIEIAEVSTEDILSDLKRSLLEKIDMTPVWFEYSKNRQKELVKSFVEHKIAADHLQIADIDKDVITDNLYESISNFGEIQYLIDNEKVSEVMINATKSVYINIDNKILNTEIKLTEKQLSFIKNTISSQCGCEDFNGIKTLKTDKYQITIIGTDVSNSGLNITIKKVEEIQPETLIKNGFLTAEVFNWIAQLADNGKNIIISGPSNSGKTTFVDMLLKTALKNKRIYLIENKPEINTELNSMVKFLPNKTNYNDLLSFIHKIEPESFVCDQNSINDLYSDISGKLVTLKADSIEDTLKAIMSSYIKNGMPEKFAKTKALKDYDYIIQLEKTDVPRVLSVVELTPAKTMPQSLKSVIKYINGKYEIKFEEEIPPKRVLKKSNGAISSRIKK